MLFLKSCFQTLQSAVNPSYLFTSKDPEVCALSGPSPSRTPGERADLSQIAARCVRRGRSEKTDAMFGPGTSLGRQDTGTVTLGVPVPCDS